MFAARIASRLSRSANQTRRHFSAHGADPDVPGVNAKRELLYGIGLGLVFGFMWKQWQWKNKAERISANNAWEKQYPVYANKIKAELEAAEAADAPEAEAATEA